MNGTFVTFLASYVSQFRCLYLLSLLFQRLVLFLVHAREIINYYILHYYFVSVLFVIMNIHRTQNILRGTIRLNNFSYILYNWLCQSGLINYDSNWAGFYFFILNINIFFLDNLFQAQREEYFLRGYVFLFFFFSKIFNELSKRKEKTLKILTIYFYTCITFIIDNFM